MASDLPGGTMSARQALAAITEDCIVIKVTRLNDKEFVVNCELIELVEANPDTTITTTTGRKLIIKESVEDIIAKTKEYKRDIYNTNK